MMDLQIIMDGPHQIYAGRQFGWTIGDHHQHRRLAAPPRQPRQHVKGGQVAPMQILDDYDPGAVRTQDFNEIAELPQHALSRGAENLIAEDDAIVVVEERRHLREPGWSM